MTLSRCVTIPAVCLIIIGILNTPLHAREKAPIRFDAFDGGRIGSKAQGMGFAFTAMADNGDAPFWNPAGLKQIPTNIFTITLDTIRTSRLSTEEIIQGEPLRGRTVTYMAFVGQNGALGFMPMADIDERKILDTQDPGNNFERTQVKINSFFISASSVYTEDLSLGLNIHYLNGRLSRLRMKTGEEPIAQIDDGNGYTLDWSMLYHKETFLSIGVMGKNLPGAIFWGDFEKTLLPAILRAGIVIRMPGRLSLAYEYEKRYYRDHTVGRPKINHVGLEVALGLNVKVRGGIFGKNLKSKDEVRYTAGVGYVYSNYIIDMSMEKYSIVKNDLTEELIFDYLASISIPFGAIGPTKR